VRPARLCVSASGDDQPGGRAVRLFISGSDSGFTYVKDNQAKTYSLDVTHGVDCYYVEPELHQTWMGTLGSGLLLWKNGVVTHIRVRDGLYDNRIYSILRDDRANFWMASSKGIFRVSEKELQDFVDGKARYLTSIPFTTGQLHFECRSGVQPAAWRTRDGRRRIGRRRVIGLVERAAAEPAQSGAQCGYLGSPFELRREGSIEAGPRDVATDHKATRDPPPGT